MVPTGTWPRPWLSLQVEELTEWPGEVVVSLVPVLLAKVTDRPEVGVRDKREGTAGGGPGSPGGGGSPVPGLLMVGLTTPSSPSWGVHIGGGSSGWLPIMGVG